MGYSYIDESQDIRHFNDGGKDQRRTGGPRTAGVDESLGTVMLGGNKKLEQMSRTPEDIFRIIVNNTINQYDLGKDVFDDAMRIMQLINNQKKRLRFKNPKAIVFGSLVLDRNNVDKKKFKSIYIDYARKEGLTKMDLLRYAFFIQRLRE